MPLFVVRLNEKCVNQWDPASSVVHLQTSLFSSNKLGVAYTGVLCSSPSYAVSVMNTQRLDIGEVAAHEVGHTFGVYHDGDIRGTYEKGCPTSGFLMAGAMSRNPVTTDLQFSICSRLRIEKSRSDWDKKGINCLRNDV